MVYEFVQLDFDPDFKIDDAALTFQSLARRADATARSGPFPLTNLPAAAVTRTQVMAAAIVAPKLVFHGDRTSNSPPPPMLTVARISQDLVVKYGTDAELNAEARTMLLVQQQSNVSMPRVYDYWNYQNLSEGHDEECCYILMQYVEGQALSSKIESLEQSQREDLQKQLLENLAALHELHSLRPGPVDGGLSTAARLFTTDGAGPFETIQDLIAWFNSCLECCKSYGKAISLDPFDNDIQDLVMCHLDLHADNLIVDSSGKLYIIDWGCAGYYPKYFEYICMKQRADGRSEAVSQSSAEWLKPVVAQIETLEGLRMETKFNRIGFALNR